MTNAELNKALYDQMFAEQVAYKSGLLAKPPAEILDHAYEYAIREDILTIMEYHDLSDERAEALLRSESPLADVYKEYERQEPGYMDVVLDSLEACADAAIQREQKRMAEIRNTPVYPYPLNYAVENGELDEYRVSQNLCIACKTAIEKAITDHYADNCLNSPAAVQQVADAFGYDRMLYVLAVTIQNKSTDGRFSVSNKKWAASFPLLADQSCSGIDNHILLFANMAHPALLDLFVREAREAQTRDKNKQKEVVTKGGNDKPSILQKLKQPVQKNAPNISANKTEPEL